MSLHKVLIISCREESRESTYIISSMLRNNGYSCEICHRNLDEKSKIKIDKLLSEEISPKEYDGIIFIDDGDDKKLSIKIAKKFNDDHKIIGGFSILGCEILRKSEILDGINVCSGLEKEVYKKSKETEDSPVVKSNDIITGSGNCADGFSVLFIDALGGKVKKIIQSLKEETASALVISKLSYWPKYWKLARKLSERGVVLAIADYEDIDFNLKIIKKMLIINPEECRTSIVSGSTIPISIMVRQGNVEIIKQLEKIGCKNINSSIAIENISNVSNITNSLKFICQVNLDNPQDNQIEILGKNNSSIISTNNKKIHNIINDNQLHAIIKKECKQTDNQENKIIVYTKRDITGWNISVIKYPIKFSKKIDSISTISLDASRILHAMSEDENGLGELQITFNAKNENPTIENISGIPNISHDVSEVMAKNSGEDKILFYIERELGGEGIFLQPDGRISMTILGEQKVVSPKEAIDILLKSAIKSTNLETKMIESGKQPDYWAEMVSLRHRNVLRCLLRLLHENGLFTFPGKTVLKTASMNKLAFESIGGANFGMALNDLDITARVWPYKEEEDWLNDKTTQNRNLPRYNPEYEDSKENDKNSYGVYYIWEEPRRSPYYWHERFSDGAYPLNKALKA